MLVKNTTIHPDTGVTLEAFGDTGAARLVPLHGEEPGKAFILDRDACLALAARLVRIAAGPSAAAEVAGAIDVGAEGIENEETRALAYDFAHAVQS